MSIRFQADADLNQMIVLATIRREPSIDFQTAPAAGLAGLADPLVLKRAAQAGRVLVSHDQRTMPRHFCDFVAEETSPGVIIVPQHLSVAAAAEDLLLIWTMTEPEEWTNRLFFLPV
jgi:hypothetical protein